MQCDKLNILPISEEIYEEAARGDYKRLAVELVEDRVHIEADHNKCVGNATDARDYQERMTDE